MSEIVKKLREYSDFAVSYGHEEACLLHVDAEEAADRIEALEAEVARLREALGEDEKPVTEEEARQAREALMQAMASSEVAQMLMSHNALLRKLARQSP